MGRKKTTTEAPKLTEAEKAIADKHGIEVKPGSLRYDEDRKKNVLTIFCVICKRAREIATQDAFQVKTCSPEVRPECKKAYRKANA